jgi:hypothetical protein
MLFPLVFRILASRKRGLLFFIFLKKEQINSMDKMALQAPDVYVTEKSISFLIYGNCNVCIKPTAFVLDFTQLDGEGKEVFDNYFCAHCGATKCFNSREYWLKQLERIKEKGLAAVAKTI